MDTPGEELGILWLPYCSCENQVALGRPQTLTHNLKSGCASTLGMGADKTSFHAASHRYLPVLFFVLEDFGFGLDHDRYVSLVP